MSKRSTMELISLVTSRDQHEIEKSALRKLQEAVTQVQVSPELADVLAKAKALEDAIKTLHEKVPVPDELVGGEEYWVHHTFHKDIPMRIQTYLDKWASDHCYRTSVHIVRKLEALHRDAKKAYPLGASEPEIREIIANLEKEVAKILK